MKYQGSTNYKTWNVGLYIDNEWELYCLAKTCRTYQDFVNNVSTSATVDGVRWDDPEIDHAELDIHIADIC